MLLLTFAPDINFGEVTARPAFIHPQAPQTIAAFAVYKQSPVDISDMTGTARPHETYGNDIAPVLVLINKLVLSEFLSMDEHARAKTAFRDIDVLRDEPLRKLPRVDSGLRRRRIVPLRRGRAKLN